MMKTTFDTNEHGEAQLTIIVAAPHDLFRFAVNMLDDQVEYCQAGREALASLPDHVGADRFDTMARSLLGDKRFEELSGWGFFEHASAEL